MSMRFYGGFPDFYTKKHRPLLYNDNTSFFDIFESRVNIPGGSVRIGTTKCVLLEVTVLVTRC